MTEPVATSAIVKTVEHNEASRLPDTSWFWRRVLIFAITAVCLWIAWRVSERVSDMGTLRQINRYVYGLLALCLMLYGIGATVTDVARLVTAFLSTKKITESSAPAPAVVTEGQAVTTAPTGQSASSVISERTYAERRADFVEEFETDPTPPDENFLSR